MNQEKEAWGKRAWIGALLFLVGSTWFVAAESLVSSLSNVNYSLVNFSSGAWAASPFRSDSNYWVLGSVRVSLTAGSQNPGSAAVRLLADHAGVPGTAVADFGVQMVTNGQGLTTFASSNVVTIARGVTYWVTVGNVAAGGLNVGTVVEPPFEFDGAAGAVAAFSLAVGQGSGTVPPVQFGSVTTNAAVLFELQGLPLVRPQLSLVRNANGSVVVSATGSAYPYRIQVSTNLSSGSWNDVGIVGLGTNGVWQFTDGSATNSSRRYYRAAAP